MVNKEVLKRLSLYYIGQDYSGISRRHLSVYLRLFQPSFHLSFVISKLLQHRALDSSNASK